MQMSWSYRCRMRARIFKLESRHIILEANSPRKEDKSLLTAIRLTNKEFQNSNEVNYFPTISPNSVHDQISEGANGVSPVHNKESFRVTVDNEESKQRSKKRTQQY